ncbi:hypothetical protein L7F22_058425 [Adiantum nelumboides]|nr:hypothetical protein [Adiantum nelumboides]
MDEWRSEYAFWTTEEEEWLQAFAIIEELYPGYTVVSIQESEQMRRFEDGFHAKFTDLWDKWVATLAIGERALDFLKRDRFVAGLCPPLKDKVKARFPVTFEVAREVAHLKERKFRYQLQHQEVDQEGDRGAQPPPGNVAPPHRGPRVVDQQELLSRITSRLEDLSMHLIRAVAPPEHGKEQRREPQDYHYYNCGEEGHQIFNAKEKAKVEEEEVSLPKGKGKGKGKEKKQEEVDAMPIKRARQEEMADSEVETMRKTKENTQVDDVSMQGPKISWPQLLYLSPKVCRQWSKMVSTRRVKTKAMGLVSGRSLKDIVPVVDAYVKGQCISNVYVDGGAQICVMSEHVFHCLGLKISAPTPYKAKMANNVKVKCLGIVNGVRVKVYEVEVEVDVYVMPTKGEGYPIILGRPWLMAMQARQDWGTRILELSPHKGSGKKTKVVRYDMKIGKQGKMEFETSSDDFNSSGYSTTTDKESSTSNESDSSREEVMGLILTEPNMVDPPDIPRVEESKLAKMLAKDLT